MDLPTCPACKQSVLDDDAVDCPFCGAPMKGGPTSARPSAAPKSAPSKSAPAKTAAPKAGPPQVSAVKAALAADKPSRVSERASEREAAKEAPPVEDDDPFAVDQSVAASAVPVSRQQGPGKTLEVTCPMCETKGFITPKAAGKLVKCCNPECMVPIFAAPAIEKKQPVAPPPKPKSKLPWLYIVGGVSAAGIAAACIWIMNQPGPRELPPIPPMPPKGGNQINDQNPDGLQNADGERGGKKKVEVQIADGQDPAAIARKQITRDALERLVDVSFNIKTNRKPLWRRLAATAYIFAGDLKHADDQLDLLEKSGTQTQNEGVLPVAALAWLQATGSPEEFTRSVDRARRLAETLPKRGRYATESAIATASLLVASGKADQARTLLANHHADPAVDQLAAAMRVVVDDQTFNLDTVLTGRTVGDWQAPLETAVTLILANHGRWDDALAWATDAADPVTRAEETTVWAESYARRAIPAEDAAGFERAIKAADGLSVDGKARLLARLAAVKFSAGDEPGAEELLTAAQTALDTINRPPAIKVQGAKALLDLKLPATIPLRQAAVAAAEIAGVQVQLAHREAAWNNILLSIRFLHAIAPSSGSMQERARQLDKEPDKIRAELKKALALKKDDEVRRAFAQYRDKFNDVAAANRVLSFWQEVVLTAAAEFGLLEQVWDELQVLDRKPIPEREPLLSSSVPLFVAARFAAAGNDKKEAEITRAVESRINPADSQVVKQICEQMFHAGDYSGCAQRLNEAMTPTGILHEWALRLACRLVKAGKFSEAIAFCSAIKDPALKDDGLFLTAALASRAGHAVEYWKASSGLEPMESAAVCSGLVVGLPAPTPAGQPANDIEDGK